MARGGKKSETKENSHSRRQQMLSVDLQHRALFVFNCYLSLRELMCVHILSEPPCFQELEATSVNGKKKSVN